MHRARLIGRAGIARAIVPRRADRQILPVRGHRAAEQVLIVERDVEIARTCIARADDALQVSAGKQAVSKIEQIDGAAIETVIVEAVIAIGTHAEQPVGAEVDRNAEPVVDIQIGDRQVLAAGIARSDDRFEHRRAEGQIGKAEQEDRAIFEDVALAAPIERRADRQAQTLQRHRRAELFGQAKARCGQRGGRPVGIAAADQVGLGEAAEIAAIAEQIDRAIIVETAQPPVIAGRADHQPPLVDRHRRTERILLVQRNDGQVAVRARIARPDNALHQRSRKGAVEEGEEIGRPCTEAISQQTGIARRSDDQQWAVQGYGGTEGIAFINPADRKVARTIIARPQGCLERHSGKAGIGEIEQIDRACVECGVTDARIARRADGKAQPAERDRHAQSVAHVQLRQVEIGAGDIVPPADPAGQFAPGKGAGGEGVKEHRTVTAVEIAVEIGPWRTHGELLALQRDAEAESAIDLEIGDIDAAGSDIAPAHTAHQLGRFECRGAEGEQIDRSGILQVVGSAVIARRTDGQPQPVERDALAEPVAILQRAQIEIAAADKALADDAGKGRRRKLRIGKGEQIDGTAVEAGVAAGTAAGGTDGQPGIAQRHRRAQAGAEAELRQRDIGSRPIALADRADQAGRNEEIVTETEKIDRANVRFVIVDATIARRADD